MNHDVTDLSAPAARAMIRSLSRGTTVASGARYLHVGHDSWLLAQRELLEELAEDGGSETKFVKGAYGAGKTHFLHVVEDIAREQGWVTSHVECQVDGVQIDRFESLYPAIVAKLRAKELESEASADDELDPVRLLLDRWSTSVQAGAHIKPAALRRPFDAEERLHSHLERGLMRSNLPSSFISALVAYARANLVGDFETSSSVVAWLKGEQDKFRVPARYRQRPDDRRAATATDAFELRPIGAGTAKDAMRGLLWVVRNAGFPGLVLCIDEIEEIAKLPQRRRRDQALQALREHVDNAGGDSYRGLCLYLAATPEMFENPDFFPRYDALQTRIQPVSEEINWRGPVVDLSQTELTREEMALVADRILKIHRIAYGDEPTEQFSPALMSRFVDEVEASRFRSGKPRQLARFIAHQVEQARQAIQRGERYEPEADISDALRQAAE